MPRRIILNLILLTALSVCSLSAQDSTEFIYEAKQFFTQISGNLLKAAQQMPARYYAFQPTHESPSFADLIGDVASSQSDFCSAVQRQHVQLEGPYSKQKADLVAILTRSVRTCASAYSSVNNFNASQQISFAGSRHTRLGLLFLNNSHDNQVYGQLAVYFRLKDLEPPSDQARLLPVTHVGKHSTNSHPDL